MYAHLKRIKGQIISCETEAEGTVFSSCYVRYRKASGVFVPNAHPPPT